MHVGSTTPNGPEPDLGILWRNRRPPPRFPVEVLGQSWGPWITVVAEASSAPPDYIAACLLASASVLIGNARWARATAGWEEPPHIWVTLVGDSGSGKSPGADVVLGQILPEIEARMRKDFPDRWADWRAASEAHQATVKNWKRAVREADNSGTSPPAPPGEAPIEPQKPRLIQVDVTMERVATLLATTAPKGLLVNRDEVIGWLESMKLRPGAREFWVQAYGGRPYRVERQKHLEPIEIERLAVGVFGGTQPEKVTKLLRDPDDGLVARLCWVWPDPVPFRLASAAPNTGWAIEALDRLRLLDLAQSAGESPRPVMVPLVEAALPDLELFAREMQERQQTAARLMRSTLGKARGLALRVSLVLEFLRWCGNSGMEAPPMEISQSAFRDACRLILDYLIPMAERVYGDAATSPEERNAETLARWLVKKRPDEVHVRYLQREVRLPDLKEARDIHAAAERLVDAGILLPVPPGAFQQRRREAYPVNPRVWDTLSCAKQGADSTNQGTYASGSSPLSPGLDQAVNRGGANATRIGASLPNAPGIPHAPRPGC